MRAEINRKVIYFFVLQLVVSLFICTFLGVFVSIHAAVSSLFGGAVCLVPGFIFALMFFKHKGARNASKIMKAFYLGEVIKLIMCGALFALVFVSYDVHALAFFATFMVIQAMYWLAPLILT